MNINPSTWPFIKATSALKQVAISNAKRIIHGEGEREEGVSQLLDWTKLTVGCGAGSQRANAPANFLANPTLISQLAGQHTHSIRLFNTWDKYNHSISNEDRLTQLYFVYPRTMWQKQTPERPLLEIQGPSKHTDPLTRVGTAQAIKKYLQVKIFAGTWKKTCWSKINGKVAACCFSCKRHPAPTLCLIDFVLLSWEA